MGRLIEFSRLSSEDGLTTSWVRSSGNSCAATFFAPASRSLAGVSLSPVGGNGVTGAGEPFLVAAQLFQRFGGEELRAVAGGMPERFQQARRDEHGNLMRFKAEKPGRLGCVESGGQSSNRETQNVARSRSYAYGARRLGRGEWVWVCFSEFFCSLSSGESASTWLGAWFLVRSSFSSISLWRRVNCW